LKSVLTGTPSAVAANSADVIYECCWQKCHWQYEDINDLTDHLLQEPNGHVQSTVNANGIYYFNLFYIVKISATDKIDLKKGGSVSNV